MSSTRWLPGVWAWTARDLRRELRQGRLVAAALIAASFVVAGQGLDILTFDGGQARTIAIGLQSGALIGVLWAIAPGTGPRGPTDADAGLLGIAAASQLGLAGAWWGTALAKAAGGTLILLVCMLTTSVLTKQMPGVTASLCAWISILVALAIASAVGASLGGLAGAGVAIGLWALGQVPGEPWMRAWSPPPVGATASPTTFGRCALLLVACVAETTRALRARRA
jgi:hypothetical protein